MARNSAHAAAHRSRAEFSLAAAQIDSRLDLELQRETDLLVAAGAFMRERPRDYALELRHWANGVGVLKRYPQIVSISTIEPASPALGGCPLSSTVSVQWTARLIPAGTAAICRNVRDLARTRDNGGLTAFGLSLSGRVKLYGESLPVYRTTAAPSTAAARRREFLGWIVVTAYPQLLLRQAISGFRNERLSIRTTSVSDLTFTTGPRIHGSSIRDQLANGTLEFVSGRTSGASIFDYETATLILLGGAGISLLVGLVMFLLGTSRERAMQLVAEMTDELGYQALHDTLTGLPNRALLVDRASNALARTARGGPPVAILFMDVDAFLGLNDEFGQAVGDQVLRAIASRLREVVRGADTVARVGGDEFAVLLDAQGSALDPELVAERILDVVGQPIELGGGEEVRTTASIGIATGHRQSAEELLGNADLALHAAKDAGQNSYVRFADEMQTALAARRSLQLELKDAIANGELFLLYQPVFNLGDGSLRGVEALLRWRHREHGVVSPDQFIPLAEESGLIVEIGLWVARHACRQAAEWQARGIELVMGINVSGRQLDEESFARDLALILDETGIEPASLIIEITETALMRDPEASACGLRELKQLGVRIAIDDFGTGYSSLAYLQQFPVDSIKIDRSFVGRVGSSGDDRALVKTLVQLGQRLRITTLGEGVENTAQLELLREAGCDLGQGFLLARPMLAEQLEAMLDDGRLQAAPVASQIPMWAAHRRDNHHPGSHAATR